MWHPDGCLLDRYGHRAVYDAGSSVGAQLSNIIHNGEWYWPYARSDRIAELHSKLPEVEIGDIMISLYGIAKKGSIYICSETCDALRIKAPPMNWWKMVWNPVAIPRYSFLLWLVFRDALINYQGKDVWIGLSWGLFMLFLPGKD